MVDNGVDIDAMGRKELQALAKEYGIKANQKSAVLMEKLREAIAVQERKDEECHGDNKVGEQERHTIIESVEEKLPKVADDTLSPKIERNSTLVEGEVPLDVSTNGEGFEGMGASEATVTSEECSTAGEIVCDETRATQAENEFHHGEAAISNQNMSEKNESAKSTEEKDLKCQEGISSSANEVPTVESGGENHAVETHDINVPIEDDTDQIIAESGDPIREQTKEVKQDTKINVTISGRKKLESKISFGADKNSIKKYHSTKNKNEKFVTKLDQSLRKPHAASESTKQSKNVSRQPIDERSSLPSTLRKPKEVPLWKIHSRDFIRKRGPDKSQKSQLEEKKPAPTTHIKRRAFQDRSNRVETNVTKDKRDVDGIKKIQPKPQPMSKRNEEQMKRFLERQSAGRKEDIKKIPPKPQAMSKRNEEQMRKFLERQSAGRKDRAEREQIKKYVHGDRS